MLVFGTNAFRVVHRGGIREHLVADSATVHVGDRLIQCLASHVVQSHVHAGDRSAVAEVRPPQLSPERAMIERVLAEQNLLQMTLDDPARSADVGSLTPADDAAVGRDLDEQCVAKAVERGGWPNLRWEFVLQLERFDVRDRQRTRLRIGGVRCLIVEGHGSEAGSEACRGGANEEVSARKLSRHEVFLKAKGWMRDGGLRRKVDESLRDSKIPVTE